MCQYFDIIYKINYTDSNNYTVSKNTEKIFFVKRNSKKDVKEDGKTYTFHLRKDAKWSDGSPVTAEDYRNTIERLEKDRLDVNLHPDAHMLPNAVMKKDQSSETLEMNIM